MSHRGSSQLELPVVSRAGRYAFDLKKRKVGHFNPRDRKYMSSPAFSVEQLPGDTKTFLNELHKIVGLHKGYFLVIDLQTLKVLLFHKTNPNDPVKQVLP